MTYEQLSGQVVWEQGLQPGDRVYVRWTNSGHAYGAYATVLKKNRASILVEIAEDTGPYYAGHKISVPLLSAFGPSLKRWSAYNCVKVSEHD